jgi:RNA polymerase sigma-70 factor (ECF subfamily)
MKQDVKIWNKVKNGDSSAFKSLYLEYVDVLYNYGKQLTNKDAILEDCIQEFFITLWQKRAHLNIQHSIKNYLILCLRRALLKRIDRFKLENADLEYTDAPIFEMEFLDETLTKKRAAQVKEAIEKLPKRQKEALFLKYYEGYSYDEIAQIMELEKHSTYKMVSKAIKRLKSLISIFL